MTRYFVAAVCAMTLACTWSLLPRQSHAQTASSANSGVKVTAKYRKVQVFDMTGMDIQGGLTSPMLTDISARTQGAKKSLIKLRRDWKKKITQGVHSL